MNTELLEPQSPACSPVLEPPSKSPRSFTARLAGCLQRLPGSVANPLRRLDWRILGIVLLAVSAIPVWRAVTVYARPQATSTAQPFAVAVARVTREDLYKEVTIPAEFRPYAEVELHAKVSGFLREIKVDFGDRVKAGQLIATLEVPELLDELHSAAATEQKTEADYTNAHLIYGRLVAVNKQHPNLVAQQELDTADARDRTTAAAIAASKAEVAKYHTLVDYTRIIAPFDGVITKRYADPGALIQSGTASDTQSLPLVRISDNYRLRLDFPVSVAYVKDTHVGDPVEVRVESLAGTSFTGIITRTTDRVEEQTRTMTTEIEVPNPNLTLVPGMYATVVLKVERRPQALAIPTGAVHTGQKPSVFVVNDKREVEERPVTLGMETPNSYEVLAGLKEGDLVLIGSGSQVRPGQTVEPKLVGPLAQQ
ncbi:MAG: efflux RND transporter periplasmic adaptor subunit [Verrucomicrobia bacterium]|nr:efflux RND transporter periplasmic adaptor subunit [Verrucomicrobiota bacterium]